VAAVSSLARYETIREDLQRILDRNRLIERIDHVISGMEEDVWLGRNLQPFTRERYAELDLREMILQGGISYGGYHRLKVEALTDEIAGLIARLSGADVQSDEFLAIRYLVRAWRDHHYVAYFEESRVTSAGDEPDGGQETKATQNEFLVKYDLAYRLRRLDFVLNKISELHGLGQKASKILKYRRITAEPSTDTEKQEFRGELGRLRRELDDVFALLHQVRETLDSSGTENPLRSEVAEVATAARLDSDRLRGFLEIFDETARREEAKHLVLGDPERTKAFNKLASELESYIGRHTIRASQRCQEILNPQELDGGGRFTRVATEVVRHYYDFYDHYDQIRYPILYSTDVGEETDMVEVIRFSSEDATSLIDERNSDRRKLAGTTLRNFGAFLDRGWRKNDIIWGRLDGAERIITTVLPGTSSQIVNERKKLIRKAQLAILGEEFELHDQDTLNQLLVETLGKVRPSDENEAALRELIKEQSDARINHTLQATLRASLNRETLLDFFGRSYEVNRRMNPKTAVRMLSRSTQVVGSMLEDIAEDYGGVGRRPAAWFARLGRIFWGLVEVAVPRSLPNLIFQHWLMLLYLFELLLIIGGALFVAPEIQRFGLVTFGVTAVIHLSTLALGDYMRGRNRWLNILKITLILVLLFLAVVGADTLYDLWTSKI
jgi:hypothetical protein